MSLLVAPCSYKAAKYAVVNWHYSRCMPMPPLVCYGVWEDKRYIGAVLFGRGNCKSLLAPYGLDVIQGAELVRVALRAHEAPVSQIVTAAVKHLKKANPGLRLLVSFADPNEGHHGGIYQAMGWTYAGQQPAAKAWRDKSGKLLHTRVASPSGWARQFGKMTRVPKHSDLTAVYLPGRHRYLLPLDRAMRRQISKLAKPYPTRGRGIDSDAPAYPAGEVGATPADRSTLAQACASR